MAVIPSYRDARIATRLNVCPGPQMETSEGRDAHASLAKGYRSKAGHRSSICCGLGIVVCGLPSGYCSVARNGGGSCHHRFAALNDGAEVKFQEVFAKFVLNVTNPSCVLYEHDNRKRFLSLLGSFVFFCHSYGCIPR